MSGPQRLAAVAAISHHRHLYNNTRTEITHTDGTHYGINVFFVSATLCGVLVAVCAACWPKSAPHKREERPRNVYTISDDHEAYQSRDEVMLRPEPPPAYDAVVERPENKHCGLQEVITDGRYEPPPPDIGRPDSGLPTYEAAVHLKDTKL